MKPIHAIIALIVIAMIAVPAVTAGKVKTSGLTCMPTFTVHSAIYGVYEEACLSSASNPERVCRYIEPNGGTFYDITNRVKFAVNRGYTGFKIQGNGIYTLEEPGTLITTVPNPGNPGAVNSIRIWYKSSCTAGPTTVEVQAGEPIRLV